MAIEDNFFNVQISLAQARAASNSFGTALQLTHGGWTSPELVRQYTDLDAHEVDFPDGTVEHLQAAAFFGANPDQRPQILKVGKCANVPTLRWAVTPVAVDGATYAVRLVEESGTVNEVSYVAGTMRDLPFTGQTVNFTAGLTVTGGTSGAKAIILTNTDGGATGTLRVVGVRGTFVNGEALTDTGGGNGTLGTQAAVTGVAATVAEIVNGLRSKLDGLGKAITFSDQTTFLRGLANVAGAWFALEVLNPALLGIAMDHADPGYAADLSAIQAEDSAWFALLDQFPSAAVVTAVASWAESRAKMYVTVTQDSKAETDVLSGATDIVAAMNAAARVNTMLIYRRRPSEFTDAGLMGVIMPKAPGSETHAFKNISGSTADALSDSQFANVTAKKGNVYITFAGKARIIEGTVASGIFADRVRFKAWQKADIEIALADACAEPDKLAMDDEGIAVIQSVTLASLKRGVAAKGLRSNPAPVVNVIAADDVPSGDRAARNLTGITALAYEAGAIHKVNPLRITFTL